MKMGANFHGNNPPNHANRYKQTNYKPPQTVDMAHKQGNGRLPD